MTQSASRFLTPPTQRTHHGCESALAVVVAVMLHGIPRRHCNSLKRNENVCNKLQQEKGANCKAKPLKTLATPAEVRGLNLIKSLRRLTCLKAGVDP
jgi:hypothetical protein